MRKHLFKRLLFPTIAAIGLVIATAKAQDEFTDDAARLVKAFSLHAGQTVGDIGAGGGELAVALARVVGPTGRVYGTELNTDRLKTIATAARTAGLTNITAIEGHATRTNLPERCCDALVIRFVYHHFKDPALMNSSLLQSLKPGGFLAVIDFAPPGGESADPAGRSEDAHHGVTAATVSRELQKAGFEPVSTETGFRGVTFMVTVRRPASER